MNKHYAPFSRQPTQVRCHWCEGYLTSTKECLSDEQKQELSEFARENGRTWKAKLSRLWENASCSSVLLQVRNRLGPAGLQAMNTSTVKRYTPRKQQLEDTDTSQSDTEFTCADCSNVFDLEDVAEPLGTSPDMLCGDCRCNRLDEESE